MHLVLGLGNPGGRYENTRHNAGFIVADRLAERAGSSIGKAQLGALVASVRLGNGVAVLAKPQGFMNRSGHPSVSLRGYFKVAPQQVIVVHDELDLPFGQVRIKRGGGHGGHNGLRDILQAFGDNEFIRVRVGISRPPPAWDVADYVLARWTPDEASALPEVVDRASDAVEAIIAEGYLAAMNRFNTRDRDSRGEERSAPSSNP